MKSPLKGEITDIAGEFVQKFMDRDYAGASEYFDDAMEKAFPESIMAETRDSLDKQLGSFIRETGKRTDQIKGYDAVYVTMEFETALLDFRVVFNKDKRVSGMQFLPAQGDAGQYVPPPYSQPTNFTEEEVTVGSGEWALPGTLTIPNGTGPFPVVILVHGSGPNDRDETIGPNKPFKDLAWGLANQGIAVLRYDKRTHAYSEKVDQDTFTVKEETVEDALAAITLLQNHTQVDPNRIYVLGHSLGGMLAPRIGAANPDIAGLIIFAGAARPLEDLILEQIIYLYELKGKLSNREETELEIMRQRIARVKDPDLSPTTLPSELPYGVPGAYWLDLRDYSPAQTARGLTMPILVLQGERDYQVTMEDFSIWQETLSSHTDATFKSYPALNHLFISGEGPATPDEYMKPANIELTVIEDIASWLLQR